MKKKQIKYDFPPSKHAKVILQSLEFYITKTYGKRCRSRAQRCSCCEMWALYDLLAVMIY